MSKCFLQEFFDGVRLSCSYHIDPRLLLLHYEVYCLYEFWRPSPITLSIQIAQNQFFLKAAFYPCDGFGDFFCHECASSSRALVVEENACGGEEPISVSILPCQMICS